MSDFTVPTLSLSGSRAKRQSNSSVPTRDQTQMPHSYPYQSGLSYNHESKYMNYESYNSKEPSQPVKRTHIFPPKHPNNNQEQTSKEINKNVYLQSPETTSYTSQNMHISYNNEQIRQFEPIPSYQGLTHNSSRRGLLTNPDSSKVVRE